MPKLSQPDRKLEALREHGNVNPRADDVSDSLFQEYEFFDSRDLMQVKYEMLRRVKIEKASITEASSAFGFSRVAFYLTRKRFEVGGLGELQPKQRGPKRAHKLTSEVMAFVERSLTEDPSLDALSLVERVKDRFGISVHPRTIERALGRRQKKRRR